MGEVARLCREHVYPRGQVIFRENDEANEAYILQEGTVTRRVQVGDGRDVMVSAVRQPGEIFGWSALVEPRRFTASAVCLDDSRVIVIEGPGLLRWMQQDSAEGFRVMRNLAGVVSSRLRDIRLQLRNALASAVISQG